MTAVLPLSPVPTVHQRLQMIFPAGIPNRNVVTREMAAKTVFVMLYVGAIADNDRWIRPDQVGRMTDPQAAATTSVDRELWIEQSMQRSRGVIQGRWYAVNTREPIRDETLRDGLVRTGAVVERPGLPTTSPRPRYALSNDFAALFNPELIGDELDNAIRQWQEANLSADALARIAIIRGGAVAQEERVPVRLPNGEIRNMDPGPSSVISKAVLERFVPRFLALPSLVWLSESGNKVVEQDDQLTQAIGLTIESDRILPDIILADLGLPQTMFVFVEVVATAGSVTEGRREDLLKMVTDAGLSEDRVTFVSAFADRDSPAFRQSVSGLAWKSFAWFMSEPDHIILMHGSHDTVQPARLSDLMGI